MTRESPATNRAQPGSTNSPTRDDTIVSTLSARSRRRANSTRATTAGRPTADRQWRVPRPDRRPAADREVQQPGPDSHRVRSRLGDRPGLQLVDDPVGEQCLCLVAADLEDDSIRQRAEKPGQQRRLARASLALDVDHLRVAHPRGGQPFIEDAQFALPPNEANGSVTELTRKRFLTPAAFDRKSPRIELGITARPYICVRRAGMHTFRIGSTRVYATPVCYLHSSPAGKRPAWPHLLTWTSGRQFSARGRS